MVQSVFVSRNSFLNDRPKKEEVDYRLIEIEVYERIKTSSIRVGLGVRWMVDVMR